MKRPTRCLHHFYQSRSQVSTLLCNVAPLSRAKLLKWSGERTGPTGQHAEEVFSGKKCVSLYFQGALVPSVSSELTLPAVPTPLLPEPGEEVVQQSRDAVTRTPEGRK